MRLLLDSNVLVRLAQGLVHTLPRGITDAISDASNDNWVSVASLWEIAIKVRLGKLRLGSAIETLDAAAISFGLFILDVRPEHVLSEPPEIGTKDPFDRLLLSQCAIDGMRLVTIDRMLASHPLAWR